MHTYNGTLQILDWLYLQVKDDEVPDPVPYYMAPYSDSRREQFLIEVSWNLTAKQFYALLCSWEQIHSADESAYHLLNVKVFRF